MTEKIDHDKETSKLEWVFHTEFGTKELVDFLANLELGDFAITARTENLKFVDLDDIKANYRQLEGTPEIAIGDIRLQFCAETYFEPAAKVAWRNTPDKNYNDLSHAIILQLKSNRSIPRILRRFNILGYLAGAACMVGVLSVFPQNFGGPQAGAISSLPAFLIGAAVLFAVSDRTARLLNKPTVFNESRVRSSINGYLKDALKVAIGGVIGAGISWYFGN